MNFHQIYPTVILLNVNQERDKQLPGFWIGEAEGAKFRLRILTKMKN